MSPSSLASGSVLGRQPAHVTEIADVARSGRVKHHQHPLVHGIDHDGQLALLLLLYRLSHPCGRAFLFPVVHDGSEGRVYPVALPPFAGQAVEVRRFGAGAWVEVKRAEIGHQLGDCGFFPRGQPVVLAVLAVAEMEFVIRRAELGLV